MTKYTFDRYARHRKYLKRPFVVEDEAGFMLLLLVGLMLVGVAFFWLL